MKDKWIITQYQDGEYKIAILIDEISAFEDYGTGVSISMKNGTGHHVAVTFEEMMELLPYSIIPQIDPK